MLDSSCFSPSARITTVVVVGGMAQCAECRAMGGVIERVKEKCRPGEKVCSPGSIRVCALVGSELSQRRRELLL